MNGYRYFAIGTIVLALMVGLFSPDDPSGESQTIVPTTSETPASRSNEAQIENYAASSASTDQSFSYIPPSQSKGDGYYLPIARTGIYESREEAAAQGREPRLLATPEAVRHMLEESRKRAGPPSP